MSVPPSPYTHRPTSDERCRVVPNKNDPPKEDCRDYLRTGRCKYGASCKYNHPANVQSGGGMKAPIDPSEPLFPIRYNEPVCQYYMKHGTCKFGQACKFHHPPQVAGTSNVLHGNNSMLLGMSIGNRKDEGGSLSHSSSMWKGGSDSGQMLPQRPDEPNCIYYLKNGRCKYGATCRYHHPINVNRTVRNGFDESRSNNSSRQSLDHLNGPKVHYVAALPPGSMQQGHFVVENGTVTFLSLDGNTPAHVVSISHPTGVAGKEFPNNGTVASTSSTSIASSFETLVSNTDNGEGSSGPFWNSRKVNGNANGAYGLPRVVSTGSSHSDSSGNVYYEPNNNNSNNNNGPGGWRGPRSASFDHTRVRSSSSLSNEEELRRSASVHSALDERAANGRTRSASMSASMVYGGTMIHRDPSNPATPTRAQLRPGEVDDGLSMMTSALLTMLDTPTEEGGPQHRHPQDHDYEIDERHAMDHQYYSRQNKNPSMIRANASLPEDSSRDYYNDNYNNSQSYFGQTQYLGQNNNGTGEDQHFGQSEYLGQNNTSIAGDDQERLDSSTHSEGYLGSRQIEGQTIINQTPRIQTWKGSATAGVIHENAQFSSIDFSQKQKHQHQQLPPTGSSDGTTNVGLYY